MTRLHQLIVLVLVATAIAAAPMAEAPEVCGVFQDDIMSKSTSKVVVKEEAKPGDKDKAKEQEKEKLSAEEKKKKVAEALKKAIDPKKAAALAEKLEREKKEKKAAAETDADKAKKDAEAAELKAILPQFEMQVRPLIRARYNFLRAIANPTKEQRAKLVAGAEEIQKAVVKVFAELQLKMQRGMWDGNSKYPNGQQLVSERFNTLAKECLDPEQLERYSKEIAKKEEIHKTICVKNLVAMIDQQLILSPEQREKLAADLTKKWDKNWVTSLEVFMYGEQFMPPLPDDVVLTHLNTSQKEVWKATPRNGGNIWGGFGFMWGNQADSGPLDKDFPNVEKPKDEQAKADEKPKDEKPKAQDEKPKDADQATEVKPKDADQATEVKPKS